MSTKVCKYSNFSGCLVGGLLGDCIGGHFEGSVTVTLESVWKHICSLKNEEEAKYSDDSAQTFAVSESIVSAKGCELYCIANHLSQAYRKQPKRGYGANVAKLLRDHLQVKEGTKKQELFAPASSQFANRGSWGNGAAMRISPISLLSVGDDEEECVRRMKESALLTHAHPHGFIGAVLQGCAILHALKGPKHSTSEKYLESLRHSLSLIQSDEILPFIRKIDSIERLLPKADAVDKEEVIQCLGNGVSALESVPTAIYCFLRNLKPSTDSPSATLNVVVFAVSLGGDTDTIASMAGAISGAYHGLSDIPNEIMRKCEGYPLALKHAKALCDMSE